MTPTLQGRRQCIRNFIDILLEAHLDPMSVRPTLGELADCLTAEEAVGLSRDEKLAIEPEPYLPHPAGNLRRGGGTDVWAHLPSSPCYLHIPGDLGVRYKFDMYGDHVALALQMAPQLHGLELSENFAEVPIDRLILDPSLVVILMSYPRHHSDIEIYVS